MVYRPFFFFPRKTSSEKIRTLKYFNNKNLTVKIEKPLSQEKQISSAMVVKLSVCCTWQTFWKVNVNKRSLKTTQLPKLPLCMLHTHLEKIIIKLQVSQI